MIPPLVGASHRVVAPDLVGFGRSDKPVERAAHTYARHVGWMAAVIRHLGLERITLMAQDWGGLIGLRLLAEQPGRFARVVTSNTGLPIGDRPMPELWEAFHEVIETAPELHIGRLVAAGCVRGIDEAVVAAYDAPFPDESFKAGPRALPDLVPRRPDDPAAAANRRAWEVLVGLDVPFLTAFSDSDPITAGADRPLQQLIPGAQGQPHTTIAGAGHFVQEDAGEPLAEIVNTFIARTA
jgi:haloalkane dehalogenase